MALFHTKEAGGFKNEDTCMFTVLGNTGVWWGRREISLGLERRTTRTWNSKEMYPTNNVPRTTGGSRRKLRIEGQKNIYLSEN